MALGGYLAREVALDFADGLISRREAMRRLALMGIEAAGASALLAACASSSEQAPSPGAQNGGTGTSPSPTAAGAAATEAITFPGAGVTLRGAFAKAASPKGGVLVIHENRGLNDHIRSVAARLAGDGYSALAIDLLSEQGGTAALGDPANVPAALQQTPTPRLVALMRAGLDELGKRAPGAKLGIIGFCFGGGMVWSLLNTGEPRLAAAAPFYGPAPANPDFSGSKAAVLAVYAESDDFVNSTRDAALAALAKAGLPHEARTFPGTMHAFFNDTGARYNPTAAADAYRAVLDWFGRHLA